MTVDPLGVAQVPSPRQNVELLADVPLFRLATGRFPATPADSDTCAHVRSPLAAMVVAYRSLAQSVGLAASAVAAPAVSPAAVPVMLVPTSADGVPNAGVTSVGEVARTTSPVPVAATKDCTTSPAVLVPSRNPVPAADGRRIIYDVTDDGA